MRASLRVSLLSVSLLVAACDPAFFFDLEDNAPVIAFGKPAEFPRDRYGQAIASYYGVMPGNIPFSRLIASAGPDSAVRYYEMWEGGGLKAEGVFDACEDTTPDCVVSRGESVGGFPASGFGSDCFIVTAPDGDRLQVRCDPDPRLASLVPLVAGQRVGRSAAWLPNDGDGAMVLGGPGAVASTPASDTRGKLYLLPRAGTALLELDTTGFSAEGDLLGTRTAAWSARTEQKSYIASSGPGRRIVVASHTTGNALCYLGCLPTPRSGTGGALAVGDFNGDGAPEVVVGDAGGALDHANNLTVYTSNDGLTCEAASTAACTSPRGGWTPTSLGCPTTYPEVACEGANFGSSLAIGDVNGDAIDDLIVGAPLASVEGAARAGAIFVYAGSPTGLVPVPSLLRLGAATENAELGASVATVRTFGGAGQVGNGVRDEPVAGAPGIDTIYMFLCSSLPGDTLNEGARCIPQAMPPM